MAAHFFVDEPVAERVYLHHGCPQMIAIFQPHYLSTAVRFQGDSNNTLRGNFGYQGYWFKEPNNNRIEGVYQWIAPDRMRIQFKWYPQLTHPEARGLVKMVTKTYRYFNEGPLRDYFEEDENHHILIWPAPRPIMEFLRREPPPPSPPTTPPSPPPRTPPPPPTRWTNAPPPPTPGTGRVRRLPRSSPTHSGTK